MLNDWLLLLTCLVAAIVILLIAFKENKRWWLAGAVFTTMLSGSLYYHYGAYQAYQEYTSIKDREVLAKEALKALKTPDAVIEKMKQTLKQHPKSAKGWFLLGRLYASTRHLNLALDAFGKAYRLDPNDMAIGLNYMQTLYLKHDKTITPAVQQIIDNIHLKDEKQIDILFFLSGDAYYHQDYLKARGYLQQVLNQLPEGTPLYQDTVKAMLDIEKKITLTE